MDEVFVPLEQWLQLLLTTTASLCLVYLAGSALSWPAPSRLWALRDRGGRVLPVLGLTAMVAVPSLARPRGHRPPAATQLTPPPPWSGSIGYPPPRLLVRTEALPSSAARAHPGVHGRTRSSEHPRERLFMRAGQPSEDGGRREAMRRHPAGRKMATAAVCGDLYVVSKGDELWSIAARALGTEEPRRVARYWPRIHRLNRAVIGSDPSLIYPGQVLRLPHECSS